MMGWITKHWFLSSILAFTAADQVYNIVKGGNGGSLIPATAPGQPITPPLPPLPPLFPPQ